MTRRRTRGRAWGAAAGLCLLSLFASSAARAGGDAEDPCRALREKNKNVPLAAYEDREHFLQSDAAEMYYSTHGPVDYAAVKKVAESEGAYEVTAMLYANGLGVPRDPEKAAFYACSSDSFDPKMLADIFQRDRTGMPADWDVCGPGYRGLSDALCGPLLAGIHTRRREEVLARLSHNGSEAARWAYNDLRAAAENLFTDQAKIAVYRIRTTKEAPSAAERGKDALWTEFSADLGELERFTPDPRNGGPGNDEKLTAVYQRYMKEVARQYDGIYLQNLLKKTQESWIPYRDAWVNLYTARWKNACPEGDLRRQIRWRFTQKRIQYIQSRPFDR